MPYQEGNEGYQAHHHEEWKAGDTRCLSHMRHQDVQNWKELELTLLTSGSYWKGWVNSMKIPSLSIAD